MTKSHGSFFGIPTFSDGWWRLVDNVAHVLAEYRQNVVFTPLMTLIQANDATEARRLAKLAIASFKSNVWDPAQFRKIEVQLLEAASPE